MANITNVYLYNQRGGNSEYAKESGDEIQLASGSNDLFSALASDIKIVEKLRHPSELSLEIHRGSEWHWKKLIEMRQRIYVEYDDNTQSAWRIRRVINEGSGENHVQIEAWPLWTDLGDRLFFKIRRPFYKQDFSFPFSSIPFKTAVKEVFSYDGSGNQDEIANFDYDNGMPGLFVLNNVTNEKVDDLDYADNLVFIDASHSYFIDVLESLRSQVFCEITFDYKTSADDAKYAGTNSSGVYVASFPQTIGNQTATEHPVEAPGDGGRGNRISLELQETDEEYYSRLIPSAGGEGDRVGISETKWIVNDSEVLVGPTRTRLYFQDSTVATPVTGDVAYLNDVFNDYAITLWKGGTPTTWSIDDTEAANNAIVVTGDATGGLTEGTDYVVFGNPALGGLTSENTYPGLGFLPLPAAETSHGVKEKALNWPDVVPYENLFIDLVGGSADMSAGTFVDDYRGLVTDVWKYNDGGKPTGPAAGHDALKITGDVTGPIDVDDVFALNLVSPDWDGGYTVTYVGLDAGNTVVGFDYRGDTGAADSPNSVTGISPSADYTSGYLPTGMQVIEAKSAVVDEAVRDDPVAGTHTIYVNGDISADLSAGDFFRVSNIGDGWNQEYTVKTGTTPTFASGRTSIETTTAIPAKSRSLGPAAAGAIWYGPNSQLNNTTTGVNLDTENRVQHGARALRVQVTTAGGGVETQNLNLQPSSRDPYYSIWLSVSVEKGRVELQLYDVTNEISHPNPQKAEQTADQIYGLSVGGIRLSGAGNHRVRVIATEDDTVFFVDAVSPTNSPTPWEYSTYMGRRALWARAAEELVAFGGDTDPQYTTSFYDLNLLGEPSTSEIALGDLLRIKDFYDGAAWKVEVDVRVEEIEYLENRLEGRIVKSVKAAKVLPRGVERLRRGIEQRSTTTLPPSHRLNPLQLEGVPMPAVGAAGFGVIVVDDNLDLYYWIGLDGPHKIFHEGVTSFEIENVVTITLSGTIDMGDTWLNDTGLNLRAVSAYSTGSSLVWWDSTTGETTEMASIWLDGVDTPANGTLYIGGGTGGAQPGTTSINASTIVTLSPNVRFDGGTSGGMEFSKNSPTSGDYEMIIYASDGGGDAAFGVDVPGFAGEVAKIFLSEGGTEQFTVSKAFNDAHTKLLLLGTEQFRLLDGGGIELKEIAEPTGSGAGWGVIYADSADSDLYYKPDGGTKQSLTGGGGGLSNPIVVDDILWVDGTGVGAPTEILIRSDSTVTTRDVLGLKAVIINSTDATYDAEGSLEVMGLETVRLESVTSQVNYVRISGGSAAGFGPFLAPAGTDTNIPLKLFGKGTGHVVISDDLVVLNNIEIQDGAKIRDQSQLEWLEFATIGGGSAVNHFGISRSSTGNYISIDARGSDANIDIDISPKGTGDLILFDSALRLDEISAPGAPSTAGEGRLYAKTGAAGLFWHKQGQSEVDLTAGGGGGDVTAAANITDHAIVRGDGGAKGVQDSGWLIDDTDVLTAPAGGTISTVSGDLAINPAGAGRTEITGDLAVLSGDTETRAIVHTNGSNILRFYGVASASPNYLSVVAASPGSNPRIDVDVGTDTNVSLEIRPRGTGGLILTDSWMEYDQISSAPGTPSTGHGYVYMKNGATALFFKDDAGSEHDLTQGAVGVHAYITVDNPTSSEDRSVFFTNRAITVTEMRAVVRGTTPSVTWTIRHHATDRSATGNEVVTSGTTTTSQTSGSDVTSFNDATIPADSFVWLETTAASGTNDELHVTIVYNVD